MLRHTTLDATCQANFERSEQLSEEVLNLIANLVSTQRRVLSQQKTYCKL